MAAWESTCNWFFFVLISAKLKITPLSMDQCSQITALFPGFPLHLAVISLGVAQCYRILNLRHLFLENLMILSNFQSKQAWKGSAYKPHNRKRPKYKWRPIYVGGSDLKGPGFNSTNGQILRTSYEGVELSFQAFPMFIWVIWRKFFFRFFALSIRGTKIALAGSSMNRFLRFFRSEN